jgi:hypothetical protein
VKKVAQDFIDRAADTLEFCGNAEKSWRMTKQERSWVYEAALLKLEVAFERFVLEALVGAINNNTSILSAATGAQFPKHLTDEACEFIVTGGGYLDFHGRDGLIRTLKRFLQAKSASPGTASHYLIDVVSHRRFKTTLDRLFALRNFAAHESRQSKLAARKAVGVNLGSAGSWLKEQGRLAQLTVQLIVMAERVKDRARY